MGETASSPRTYNTSCLTGIALEWFAHLAKDRKRRSCYEPLERYFCAVPDGKAFILFGLHRTGKSTMLRQAVLRMTDEERARTASITVSAYDTLHGLNQDLRSLANDGYSCVLIDGVTMLDDFIESAALFADVYAGMGMKIVLSGADSLGFLFSEDEQLYDRCHLLHTTFIPYRKFERVLGIQGIVESIRYGGTVRMSGVEYGARPRLPLQTPMLIAPSQGYPEISSPPSTRRPFQASSGSV